MTTEKELEEIAKQSQKTVDLIRAYQTVFKTEDGQKVLFDLMQYGCFITPIASVDLPEYVAWINEGKRSVVLEILKLMNKDVEQVHNMIAESIRQEKEYDVR